MGVRLSEAHFYAVLRIISKSKARKRKHADYKVRLWVVEITDSFLNIFSKLLVRFKKKTDNYFASLHFACPVIVWKKRFSAHKYFFADRLLAIQFLQKILF